MSVAERMMKGEWKRQHTDVLQGTQWRLMCHLPSRLWILYNVTWKNGWFQHNQWKWHTNDRRHSQSINGYHQNLSTTTSKGNQGNQTGSVWVLGMNTTRLAWHNSTAVIKAPTSFAPMLSRFQPALPTQNSASFAACLWSLKSVMRIEATFGII